MYYKYNNISMYYEKHGEKNKKSILILPGWGDNRNTFKKIISYLEDQYNIYIFDYPGFGKSGVPEKNLTIYDYSTYFINFLKNLKIKNPIVIAHSFGGRIAITMSGYYKVNFNKIILMSSAGIKPIKSKKQILKENIYRFLKRISHILPGNIKKMYLRKLINIFGSSDYKQLPQELHNTFKNIINEDLSCYLNKITSDVLLLWGENDTQTPISDAHKMNKLINNSALISIKNTSHFFYLEKPLYIKKILVSYLKN